MMKHWRDKQLSESYALIQHVMQNALETQVRFENHATGLNQLKGIFRRMSQGKARYYTTNWKEAYAEARFRIRAENVRFEATLMEEKAAESHRKGIAMKQLSIIMRSLVKGEVSMRLEEWRQKKNTTQRLENLRGSQAGGLRLINKMCLSLTHSNPNPNPNPNWRLETHQQDACLLSSISGW